MLAPEALLALVSPLLDLVGAVDGLCVLILDLYELCSFLDGHLHVDELDQFRALLVSDFGVFSCHQIAFELIINYDKTRAFYTSISN